MRVVCVAGGSYKSFYLNYFVNLRRCDLLILNFNIFYKINSLEQFNNSSVVSEIVNLFLLKRCVVVAGVFIGNKQYVVVYKNGKLQMNIAAKGIIVNIKRQKFLVSTIQHSTRIKNKIIFTKSKVKSCFNCSNQKQYIFVSPNGVDLVRKQKLKRIFNKCSQFSLK